MIDIHPQFIKKENGTNSHVILSVEEYNALIEELEDMEDVILYDEAKKNDTGERIPFEEAIKRIESERGVKV